MIVDTNSNVNPLDLLKSKRSVIVGMSTSLKNTSCLGGRTLGGRHLFSGYGLGLGDIVTYELDEVRKLHVVACYNLGAGGWLNADRYLTIGLNHLWWCNPRADYSIIEPGTEPQCIRYGADHAQIYRAMEQSFPRLFLYRQGRELRLQATDTALSVQPPLRPLSVWHVNSGEHSLRMT